jgi:hypothetical protein
LFDKLSDYQLFKEYPAPWSERERMSKAKQSKAKLASIFLNTLFSKTLSLCSSIKVRDQVLHAYSTTGKITILYILIFSFLYEMGRQKILV